jgi:hypothetical protein
MLRSLIDVIVTCESTALSAWPIACSESFHGATGRELANSLGYGLDAWICQRRLTPHVVGGRIAGCIALGLMNPQHVGGQPHT